jgi:hypothetical protein
MISAKPSRASHIQNGTMKSNIKAPANMAIPARSLRLLQCLMPINSTPVMDYMRSGAARCHAFRAKTHFNYFLR